MRKLLIVQVLTLLFSTHGHAGSTYCETNFRVSKNKIQHNYLPEAVMQLSHFSKEKNPVAGWKLLGELGDDYAQIAYNVLNSSTSIKNKLYFNLIKNHWINVVGVETYNENFSKVAAQHFRQYVQIINDGIVPDSDQIILSYLTAAKKYNLPELIVFDAAWELSGLQSIKSWQVLNHLTNERIVSPTNVCLSSSNSLALEIILEDLAESAFFPF